MRHLLRQAVAVLLAWALIHGGLASVMASGLPASELAAETASGETLPLDEPASDPPEPEGETSDEAPETDCTACGPREERRPSFAIERLSGADEPPGDTIADPPSPPPRR